MQRLKKSKAGKGTNTAGQHDTRRRYLNEIIRGEIDAAMKEQEISDKEMERRTGIAATTIRRILMGFIESPPLDKVALMYDALNLDMPHTRQLQPKFTLPELSMQGASFMTYPALPSEEDRKRAESLLRALADAGALLVRAA